MGDVVIKEGVHFVGNACVKCENTVRYVKDRRCVLCKKEQDKRRYQNNPEHHKQNAIHRQRKIKELNKDKGTHFEGNPCIKCGGCIRYVSSGGCVLCMAKRGKQRRENSPEYQKQWQQKNPEKVKVNHQTRRARKQNAEGCFTAQEWIDLCNQYNNKCLSCGDQKPLEADHIIPLSEGGTNWISNIQPLCKSCNCSKGTKTINYRQ